VNPTPQRLRVSAVYFGLESGWGLDGPTDAPTCLLSRARLIECKLMHRLSPMPEDPRGGLCQLAMIAHQCRRAEFRGAVLSVLMEITVERFNV
jgi:hypothetical protein